MEDLNSRPGAPGIRLILDPKMQARIWSIREQGASATQMSETSGKPDAIVGWEDADVDPARVGDCLREFQALADRHGHPTSLLGHLHPGPAAGLWPHGIRVAVQAPALPLLEPSMLLPLTRPE